MVVRRSLLWGICLAAIAGAPVASAASDEAGSTEWRKLEASSLERGRYAVPIKLEKAQETERSGESAPVYVRVLSAALKCPIVVLGPLDKIRPTVGTLAAGELMQTLAAQLGRQYSWVFCGDALILAGFWMTDSGILSTQSISSIASLKQPVKNSFQVPDIACAVEKLTSRFGARLVVELWDTTGRIGVAAERMAVDPAGRSGVDVLRWIACATGSDWQKRLNWHLLCLSGKDPDETDDPFVRRVENIRAFKRSLTPEQWERAASTSGLAFHHDLSRYQQSLLRSVFSNGSARTRAAVETPSSGLAFRFRPADVGIPARMDFLTGARGTIGSIMLR